MKGSFQDSKTHGHLFLLVSLRAVCGGLLKDLLTSFVALGRILIFISPSFLISKMEIKGILCRFMAKIVYTCGIMYVNCLAQCMARSK